jgi:hypothetical protein
MGRADPVAVGDRGQSLDVRTEHALESPGLGFAQLGELGGDVRDRAVVLADLHSCPGVLGRGSVSVRAERLGEGLGAPHRAAGGTHVGLEQLGE